MGRSFESVRMGAREVSERWLKARRALKKDEQIYAQRLAEMARKHSSEAFYAFDDPLEAAVFSVLLEMMKVMEAGKAGGGPMEGAGWCLADHDHDGKRGQDGRSGDEGGTGGGTECGSSTPDTGDGSSCGPRRDQSQSKRAG